MRQLGHLSSGLIPGLILAAPFWGAVALLVVR